MDAKELENAIYYNEFFDYENSYLFLEEDDEFEDVIEFDENNFIIRNKIKHGAEKIEEKLSKINLLTEIASIKKNLSWLKYKKKEKRISNTENAKASASSVSCVGNDCGCGLFRCECQCGGFRSRDGISD
jgi:DNA-directed RNA polymerase beta' subunit